MPDFVADNRLVPLVGAGAILPRRTIDVVVSGFSLIRGTSALADDMRAKAADRAKAAFSGPVAARSGPLPGSE